MIRHDEMKNNDVLCGLNMKNATNQQMLAWYMQIVENELQKPEDEQDSVLLCECFHAIDELQQEKVPVTEEDLKRGYAKMQQMRKDAKGTPACQNKRHVLRKRAAAWAAAVAASFVLLFGGVSVAAYARGYSSAAAYLKANLEKLRFCNAGDSFKQGNITLIKNGTTKSYASIESLIKAEQLPICYPTWLPDGVSIERVLEAQMNDNQFSWSLILNEDKENISLMIFNVQVTSDEDLKEYPIHSTSIMDYYIQPLSEGAYLGVGVYNGYEYQITCNSYEALIKILDNMKGL